MFKFKNVFFVIIFQTFFTVKSFSQTLCFYNNNNKTKIIKLKLVLPISDSSIAKLLYEKGSTELSLTRMKTEVLPPVNAVPATVRTNFSEIINGKKTGIYQLTTQGAMVGELTYKNLAKKTKFYFFEDKDSHPSNSCNWGKFEPEVAK